MTPVARMYALVRGEYPRADFQQLFKHSITLATRELLKGFSK